MSWTLVGVELLEERFYFCWDVVMLDSVDIMTGVVWMGGVVVGLSVIDC